ncbi:DUF2868 domain-containing protein [Actomonas aquatica]|uniref:DUF2868 domain-containing protein n=1 Tax=Actomonas aquatica TaxID=2866162 RepID=A0ABZ1C9L3_9BACT|nr:DUF2868 domain-containing protein [Opitutus sp. WL0086]WRQ88330.1 DUF2868 domain-containing protein [Opitutus sp. WL0086]
MSSFHRSNPDLADLVVLAAALDRDEGQTADERAQRDSEIARHLPTGTENRTASALTWLEAWREQEPELQTLQERVETGTRLTDGVLAAIGVFFGASAAFSAFYFDGTGRVNAVLVLALLVVLPGLLLLPFVAAALPASLARRVPGVGVLAGLGRGLSTGRLALLCWRFFPADLRDALQLVSSRWRQHRQLYAQLQKWVLLRWSQVLAVCFQISALTCTLLLVVFTDLTFGWSTTLTSGEATRDATRVHQITDVLATPWSWAWPAAAPDEVLIRDSRFYRVTAEALTATEAARLGGWWPFVVMCIAVYGLGPRLLTFALARRQCAQARRLALVEIPGLSAVLRRLHRQQLSAQAESPEREDPSPVEPRSSTPSNAQPSALQLVTVINWSGVPNDGDVIDRHFPNTPQQAAGGGATTAEDDAVIAQISPQLSSPDHAALIVVKAWEPPLMDCLDFLRALRTAARHPLAPIVVLPVGLEGLDTLNRATDAQLELWTRKLRSLGDPALRVVAQPAEVTL